MICHTTLIRGRVREALTGLAFSAIFLLALTVAWSTGAQQSTSSPAAQQAPPATPSQSQPSPADESRPPSRSAGGISGRVLGDDGHPMANVAVFVTSLGGAGGMGTTRRTTNTDENGNFRVADLVAGAYFVSADVRGYVSSSFLTIERGDRPYYRVGESVTITMIKGGVITGKVTNANGEPVVATSVRAYRVRDSEGQPTRASFGNERQTDDRGIYRLYGLTPGTYLVAAVGSGQFFGRPSAYEGHAPTYYPSATRDTAAEVTVRSGEEASSIDIRYRGEPGHAVSGTVAGAVDSASAVGGVSVALTHLAGGAVVGQSYIQNNDPARGFGFYGVPDGEYEVRARRSGLPTSEGAVSPPRRVTVKGADVTGLELTLAPLASLAGRLILEPAPEAGRKDGCESKRRAALEETVITARRDEKVAREDQPSFTASALDNTPSEKGEFLLRNLEAAHYRLTAQLPSENWYVRAITLPGAGRARQVVDAARNGLTLKSGERVAGLTVTLAEGAAVVSGRVVAAAEGARLPGRLRVHLVPVEREGADDPLRYTEILAGKDGRFTLSHLAPGRYWLVTRAADEEINEMVIRPAAWDSESRAKLRREAEAANTVIELQPCQRLTDYTLRYRSSPNK